MDFGRPLFREDRRGNGRERWLYCSKAQPPPISETLSTCCNLSLKADLLFQPPPKRQHPCSSGVITSPCVFLVHHPSLLGHKDNLWKLSTCARKLTLPAGLTSSLGWKLEARDQVSSCCRCILHNMPGTAPHAIREKGRKEKRKRGRWLLLCRPTSSPCTVLHERTSLPVPQGSPLTLRNST